MTNTHTRARARAHTHYLCQSLYVCIDHPLSASLALSACLLQELGTSVEIGSVMFDCESWVGWKHTALPPQPLSHALLSPCISLMGLVCLCVSLCVSVCLCVSLCASVCLCVPLCVP